MERSPTAADNLGKTHTTSRSATHRAVPEMLVSANAIRITYLKSSITTVSEQAKSNNPATSRLDHTQYDVLLASSFNPPIRQIQKTLKNQPSTSAKNGHQRPNMVDHNRAPNLPSARRSRQTQSPPLTHGARRITLPLTLHELSDSHPDSLLTNLPNDLHRKLHLHSRHLLLQRWRQFARRRAGRDLRHVDVDCAADDLHADVLGRRRREPDAEC